MKEENLEKIGLLIDKLDNIIQMSERPLRGEIHWQGVKNQFPIIRKEIHTVYKDEGGSEF